MAVPLPAYMAFFRPAPVVFLAILTSVAAAQTTQPAGNTSACLTDDEVHQVVIRADSSLDEPSADLEIVRLDGCRYRVTFHRPVEGSYIVIRKVGKFRRDVPEISLEDDTAMTRMLTVDSSLLRRGNLPASTATPAEPVGLSPMRGILSVVIIGGMLGLWFVLYRLANRSKSRVQPQAPTLSPDVANTLGKTVVAVGVGALAFIGLWWFTIRTKPIDGEWVGSAQVPVAGAVLTTDVTLSVSGVKGRDVPVAMTLVHGVRGPGEPVQRFNCQGSFALPEGWSSNRPLDTYLNVRCPDGAPTSFRLHLFDGQGSVILAEEWGGRASLHRR